MCPAVGALGLEWAFSREFFLNFGVFWSSLVMSSSAISAPRTITGDESCLCLLQVAGEFRGEIESDIASMSKAVSESELEERRIDEEHNKFTERAQSAETAIQQQTTELKQLIDRQADRLLRQVNVARQQRDEEVTRRKKDVEMNRLVLLDFQKYSQQIKDKGTVRNCSPMTS